MINCIIIDDERHCIGTLALLLQANFSEVNIVATCRNGNEGLEAIIKFNPDLVFLDIAMPGMDGFEMLSHIDQPDFEIIFTTAFDNHAIRAFKVNAVDYLLKPINKDEFTKAVDRALSKIQASRSAEQPIDLRQLYSLLDYLKEDNNGEGRIAIPTLEGFQMIKLDRIYYILSDGNYSKIYYKDKSPELVTRSLKQLEKMLSGSNFVRIHRQTLVNINHIDKYVRGEGGYVVLTNGIHLDVSRRKKEDLLKIIRN